MEESILKSIRKRLGPESEADGFDEDILMGINSALNILTMNGVGPAEGLLVTDESTTWDELTDNPRILGMVKDYVFFSVKQGFDPSATSFVNQAQSEVMASRLWYIREQLEYEKVINE